jgi:ATP-dependent exoDNAse (exonuclease V) beta subunit
LELTDFKTKDVSIIQEEKERNIIANVLKLPLFANLQGKTIYKEYAFFDEEANTSGFIDCLIVDETAKEITIIDYKTKNINDEEYVNQLGKYEKNISAIFKGYAIKKYLLSILEGRDPRNQIKSGWPHDHPFSLSFIRASVYEACRR